MTKVMLTLTGPFDGGDPSTGEVRTMTIGEADPARLPAACAEWVALVVERMLDLPEPEQPDALRLAWDDFFADGAA